MRYGIGSGELSTIEAAEMVAKMQEVPVSRIEDIDVLKDTVEYAISGKYFTVKTKKLLRRAA